MYREKAVVKQRRKNSLNKVKENGEKKKKLSERDKIQTK